MDNNIINTLMNITTNAIIQNFMDFIGGGPAPATPLIATPLISDDENYPPLIVDVLPWIFVDI